MTLPLQFYYLNYNPSNPIPNGPFASAQSFYVQGPYSPLVVGAGLSVNYTTSTLSASGGGGSSTWATLADKTGTSGPTDIALGLDAGASQGTGAVAIGALAGSTGQATAAIAIGGGAAVSNQGACAVALGQSAGITDQGVEALALGSQAGTTSQAACSIVINASGAPLENTVTGTTVIAPVRNAGSTGLPVGFKQVAYNPATGELVYYS
jgi:hypothetical protein